MNNDLNLHSLFLAEDKDNEILPSDKTSIDEDHVPPLSILRLILSPTFYNNSRNFKLSDYKDRRSNNYKIKKGCTCIATKVCGKTLGSIVNPILNRSFSNKQGGIKL